jgi:DNA-3-methyladenine glycosylase
MDDRFLCAGPGRLTEAMGITQAEDGSALDVAPFELFARESEPEIAVGPRIGITKAADLPWRYGLKGSRFLSKPFPKW